MDLIIVGNLIIVGYVHSERDGVTINMLGIQYLLYTEAFISNSSQGAIFFLLPVLNTIQLGVCMGPEGITNIHWTYGMYGIVIVPSRAGTSSLVLF